MQTIRSRTLRRRRAPSNSAAPIVHLWLLRMLVPLGAHREAIGFSSLLDDTLARTLGLDRWIGVEADKSARRAVFQDLRELYDAAERSAHEARIPELLARNAARLSELVGLDEVACRILEFAVMLANEQLLESAACHFGSLTSLRVHHIVSTVLALPAVAVQEALKSQGPLSQSGLLAGTRRGAGALSHKLGLLSDHLADQLVSTDADPIALLRETLLPSAPGHLTLEDFPHLASPLALLRPYLRKALDGRRTGVNILLHGSPGTGKNQLVKALAADLSCALYEISGEDDDGDPVNGYMRLRAYRVAQCVLSRSRALLLFDEIQDVFENSAPRNVGEDRSIKGRKAWINRVLESNPVPALWLTNSISAIDPAFLRRFDMVLEVAVPPRSQREKIVFQTCGGILDARGISRLSECESLAPAVVARAASVVQLVADDLTGITPTAAVSALIDQTLRAQGHAGLPRVRAPDAADIYDLAFINVDTNLPALVHGLLASGAGRLCLYGPPGTGKSAWAHWLADTLERPLLVRRASDLLSMWVGETEKKIAGAFHAATSGRAVLLIDEVENFLEDRRHAQRSWEVTLVNEMLTQMEDFDGLFLVSTNLMDKLDSAALRRFDVKLRFDYLRPDQSTPLLEKYLTHLALPPPDAALLSRLRRLMQLTPGDFATIGRQHRLRPFTSAAAVVSELEAEVALKRQGVARPIGFV